MGRNGPEGSYLKEEEKILATLNADQTKRLIGSKPKGRNQTRAHTLRHTMAVSYLRAGGNLYYLQRILGHSSITTTESTCDPLVSPIFRRCELN